METQSMLDALTDHLAIYHRSSTSSDVKVESSTARHAVVQWLVGLSCQQRRAVLTVVDTSWVAILLMMQKYLRTEGLCTFFLLPDVLSMTDRERPTASPVVSNASKATRKSSNGRGISKGRNKGVTEDSSFADGKRVANEQFTTSSAALPLPELCFRRSRGLILRSETGIQQTSGNLLVNSVRLFSSGDGEKESKGNRLCSSSFGNSSCTSLDCVTVTEDFIADIGTFLKVMDHLSHHEFLNKPPFLSAAAASTWGETSWLKAMGYYSMPAFIANRFEFELWAAWNRAQGTKKPARSLSLKTTKGATRNGWVAAGNSLGNAGVAASVFERKQGCMDWWRKLDRKDRAGLVKCASAHLTKVEVLKNVWEARAGRGKTNDVKTRARSWTASKDFGGNAKLNIGNRNSVSDSEVEQQVKVGTDDRQGAEITSYFTGLRALRELSDYGLLPCGKSQVTESIEEDDDSSWLFGSKFESVHTFSDQIRRQVRSAVVKVKNDHIELELLGDGSTSNKGHEGNSEDKISKTKKKKRKNITTPKAEAHKEEDMINCSFKTELPQEERKQQLGQLQGDSGDAELQQTRSSIVDEAGNEVKSLSGGKQNGSRKGKGRKSKGNKDDKLHQPTVGSKKSALNGAEDFPRYSMDIRSYFNGSLETGNGPCSEFDGPATSGDRSFDINPSLKNQVESPAKFMGHCSTVKSSSICSIVHLGQRKPEKLRNTPIPSLRSTSDKTSINNKENDEVLPDKVVSTMETVTGPRASHTDICQVGSSLGTTPAVFQYTPCPVSTCGTSDSKNDCYEDRSCDQTLFEASVPIEEDGQFPFEEKQNSVPDSQKTTSTLESPIIRFGTVDAAALPDSNKTNSVPVASLICNNEERSPETSSSSNAKHVPSSSRNGRLRLPLPSRQLDYSTSSRHSHYQQNPSFRSVPHEWPGSPQYGYFGAYHQPKATDWLQLDVGHGWPHRMEPSLLSYSRNMAPVQLRQQNGIAAVESLIPITVSTRNGNGMGNLDRPPILQPSYNITPAVGYTVAASKEEPRHNVRSFFNPSPFSSGYGDVEEYGQARSTDDSEHETKLFAYDTDADDYGMYKSSGELDDLDGYMISEEEGERYVEDAAGAENNSSDYHQIFGGGVMYWNASDYAGLGYSRPGSLSSEDSSWARHEADLSAVLDDIVNYQAHQNSYSNVPSCSPSPPSSSSVPKSFERLSPVASSTARARMPRPTTAKPDFNSGKFGQPPPIGLSLDDQLVGARLPIAVEMTSSAQPILRPIVVVRDRQVPSGEIRRLQEAKSPHIVPRSRRDLPGHRMRPPSPVLRCVPPAPPPPPPSPVSGPRRRKGLMGARSGSSSPRHWGLVNWPYKDDSDGSEGNVKGDQEGFPILGGRKRGSTTSTPLMHPLSGALLRERLVAIPSLSLEQEHPDVSIPMKTTLLHNSNPALHLALTELLSALHVEIEAFSLQVEAENKMRKPFINLAVKKVAHSLQVLWPRSRINIFGSIATGLALPTSDVDLVVCLPPVRNLEPIKEAGILEGRNGIKETSLQHAARYLADQDWVKNDTMKTIENTPVPIIMMVAEFLPHQCEVGDEDTSSFSPSLGKEACEEAPKTENGVTVPLIESVTCREDSNFATDEKKGPWGAKAARQLVHLDISFLTPSHTGLRTAELVRELVGQYPALSPLALVLKQFLTDRSLDHPYSGGLSSYCLVLLITRFLQHQHHHGKPCSNQNLGKLFMDFLHFFGCDFDPLKMGIRIRGGGMYLSRDRYNDIDPLYIEDPLHPDNNVGRNCFRILQCVKAFADGYAVLERKLRDISIGTDDVKEGAEGLQLLQMILPCIMTKYSLNNKPGELQVDLCLRCKVAGSTRGQNINAWGLAGSRKGVNTLDGQPFVYYWKSRHR